MEVILKKITSIIILTVVLALLYTFQIEESDSMFTEVEKKIIEFQNDDGGFSFYTDSEMTLYYTYSYLDTMDVLNIPIEDKIEIRKWMEGIDLEYLFNQDSYDSLKNIYYFIKIAEFCEYDIKSEIIDEIRETISKLHDENGIFYLSELHREKSNDEYEAMRLLSNSYAIEIYKILGDNLPNEKYLHNWIISIAYLDDGTINKKVGYFIASMRMLEMLGVDIEEFKQRAEELNSVYALDEAKASIYDIYCYSMLVNYLGVDDKYSNDVIVSVLNKHKLSNGFFSNSGKSNSVGDIYATNLVAKMHNSKEYFLDKDLLIN